MCASEALFENLHNTTRLCVGTCTPRKQVRSTRGRHTRLCNAIATQLPGSLPHPSYDGSIRSNPRCQPLCRRFSVDPLRGQILSTNLFGVINGLNAYVPSFRARAADAKPAAIVVTGSKQGITNPPGNAAYNASKSAVKTLTEHLSWDLRESKKVGVHLLVPGWTFTGLVRRALFLFPETCRPVSASWVPPFRPAFSGLRPSLACP